MDLYRIFALAHVIFAVVLVGLALFWFIMLMALRQRFDAPETARLLAVVNGARWPHVVIPYALRLALPWVSWVTLAVLGTTGSVLLSFRPVAAGPWWWTKMVLLAAIVGVQILATRRPAAPLIRLNLFLVLGVLLASGLLLRG
jgi:hypothetical protein